MELPEAGPEAASVGCGEASEVGTGVQAGMEALDLRGAAEDVPLKACMELWGRVPEHHRVCLWKDT